MIKKEEGGRRRQGREEKVKVEKKQGDEGIQRAGLRAAEKLGILT